MGRIVKRISRLALLAGQPPAAAIFLAAPQRHVLSRRPGLALGCPASARVLEEMVDHHDRGACGTAAAGLVASHGDRCSCAQHCLGVPRIAEVPGADSSVRMYRINGGATTAYGIVIRQERSVLPGLLLVRNVDTFYPCYSVDLARTRDGFQVLPPSDESCVAREQAYRLQRFVYF
jgi:hypothetical protein